jgi:organic hydroperoxide reductase OsmC/OhrA
METYQARVRWHRSEGDVHSRAHEWSFDGGMGVHASASPLIIPLPFSDPAGIDPEEALVAALSSCHMLFFLSFAAKEGFVVIS